MHTSPLRYPGGEGKISNYIKVIFKQNMILDGHYMEPYAGGAGVALDLLFSEFVRYIHINDIDKSIFSFWSSVLHETDDLCRMIEKTPVTVAEWKKQKYIQDNPSEYSILEIGFSTFFLNRTNRSGIILGGLIGGKNQDGPFKMDARFNKIALILRIKRIAKYKNRIVLYNRDAAELLKEEWGDKSSKNLVYLDPPYYIKGQDLYRNYYNDNDHVLIANLVKEMESHWIVSYDNNSRIKELYQSYRSLIYGLNYSASTKYQGSEVVIFSNGLIVPEIENPTQITSKMSNKFQAALDFV